MSNGQFNMVPSQDDRVPAEPGPFEERQFADNEFPWTYAFFDGGIDIGMATMPFFGVPMIQPENIVGEVTIELSVFLNLSTRDEFDTGVDLALYNTNIGRNIWRSNAVWPIPMFGSSCPNMDVYAIKMSAEAFFNARQMWSSFPGADEGTVVFHTHVINPRAAACGNPFGDPPYPQSLVRISGFSFNYLVPSDDMPLGLKMWDEDLCQNMVMVPTFRAGEPYPQLLSTHTTRVMARMPSPTEEVCRYHSAEVVIDKDGFARGFYCGKSEPSGDPEQQRNYYADAYIVQEGDTVLRGQAPVGFGCFLGSYHTPKWTEAQLWSHKHICNVIV